MAQTEFHDVLSVESKLLLSVIQNYGDYPDFIDGCTGVQVGEKKDGKVRVSYRVNLMSQDVQYTLDHVENPEEGKIEWHLVESNFFKKNNGRWEIKSLGDGKTDVTYALDVEFKVPVPGFILNRLVKGSLPGMVKSFEKQAKKKKNG